MKTCFLLGLDPLTAATDRTCQDVRLNSRYARVDVVSVDLRGRTAAIVLLRSIVVIGAGWALLQALLTLVILGIPELDGFDCSLDQPIAAYIVLTGVVVVSVIASGYLVTRLRRRAAGITAFVGAVGALTWMSLGGFADYSCDLGILIRPPADQSP
jgi:hypothetical protein